MRAAMLVGVMVLASCGSSGGVELVITPPPDVDRIALYVGIGDEMRQGLAPSGFTQPIVTSTWIRDAHNELSEVKNVGGRTVSFGLIGPAEPLSIIIAVGFNAEGKPVAAAVLPKESRPLTVPRSFVARYELTLTPIVAVDPQSRLDIRVWKPSDPSAPGEQAECVLALDAAAGERVAVVPEGDPDCDAWRTETDDKECLSSVFMGTKPPKLDPAINCLLAQTASDNNGTAVTQTAVLGGDHCVDGKGVVSGCFASNYCMPKSVLDSCGTGGFDCAQDITAHNINVPTHMQCLIRHNSLGELCTDPIPGFENARGIVDTHMCKAGSFRITRPSQPWSTTVNVSTESGSTTFALTLASPTTDCGFTITPTAGMTPVTSTAYAQAGALIAADLDNGRGIAMPYVFIVDQYPSACGAPEPCILKLGAGVIPDGTFQCMNNPAL